MEAIKTEGLTKYYGKNRGIVGAVSLVCIAAAYLKYRKKDVR